MRRSSDEAHLAPSTPLDDPVYPALRVHSPAIAPIVCSRVERDFHPRDHVRYLARSVHIALVHCVSRRASVNHST
jgi:hypothetical protein